VTTAAQNQTTRTLGPQRKNAPHECGQKVVRRTSRVNPRPLFDIREDDDQPIPGGDRDQAAGGFEPVRAETALRDEAVAPNFQGHVAAQIGLERAPAFATNLETRPLTL